MVREHQLLPPKHSTHTLLPRIHLYKHCIYNHIHTISVSDSHERIHPPRPHLPPIPQTNIFYILYIYIALTFFSCHICPKPYTCWVMIRIPNFVYMLWYFFLAGQSTVSSVPGGQGQMSTSGSSSLPTSAVIGAAIGGIFVLILIIAIVCFARRKKSRYET